MLRVATQVFDNTGKPIRREDRYFISSLPRFRLTAEHRLLVIRHHWAVETAHQRLIAEDYSSCRAHHPAYSAPNFTAGTGIEALYRYDTADPDSGTLEDAAGRTLEIDSALLWGRSVSVSDLGAKSLVRYDARGRATGTAMRVVKPGAPSTALSDRYAPRWYIKEGVLDAANRPLESSTGASSAELLGSDGRSVVQSEYTARGILKRTMSSYGTLLDSQIIDANGLPRRLVSGDAAGTERAFSYDEWPDSAKPVTTNTITSATLAERRTTPADSSTVRSGPSRMGRRARGRIVSRARQIAP